MNFPTPTNWLLVPRAHAQQVFSFSVNLSVCQSGLREGYRVEECLPEGMIVLYQCSLQEHYNYLLIPTCTERS